MQCHPFAASQLPELMRWFPSPGSCTEWAGPGFRFPFTEASFREDLQLSLASLALSDTAGELLGFGQYYLREGRCHLARLAISPRHRGRRAGETLIRHLVRRGARALGTAECSLFVLESNAPALRLYTRLGFTPAEYPGARLPVGNSIYMIAPCTQISGAHATPRPATRADIPAIWAVRYAVTENTLVPGRISDQDVRREIEDTGRGWVIEVNGTIKGFAIGNGVNGNVWALFVHPDAQGLGLGTCLNDCMLGWFRTQPPRRLWLTTGANTRARHFYASRGWQEMGLEAEDEVRFERDNLPAPAAIHL